LDENAVYKSVDGESCDTFEKMAAAFLRNQSHYSKALKNADDDYYLYLQAIGNTKERDLFLGYFKKFEPKVALWKTIYYLDETTPFWLGTEDKKSKNPYIVCKTADELIVAFRENPISDDAWDSFVDGRFMAWYATQNDPDTYQKIEKVIADSGVSFSAKVHAIMYYLNPRVSINLYLPDEDDDQYYFTKSEIGNYLNHYARRKFQDKEKESFLESRINELGSNKSWLHYYFDSKGWTKEDKWVRYCFELTSADNKKKCGPYNKEIALYKAIKGLEFDPYYYFPKSKKYVYTLEDLSKISSEEIATQMEKGALKSWLTIFFQENPYADLKPKRAYEKLTKEYVEFLDKLNEKTPEAERYYEAIGITEQMKKIVKGRFNAVRVLNIIFGALFLIPRWRCWQH
jgi:hypothetical protein